MKEAIDVEVFARLFYLHIPEQPRSLAKKRRRSINYRY